MPARAKQPNVRDRLGRDGLFQISADLPRIIEIDIEGITPNPEQPRDRIDPDTLEELKTSIARHGLLQPILVRRGEGEAGFTLIAGQRRLEAMRSLGRSTVPSIITDGDPGEIALVENLQRQDLGPFEEARAVARLMERFSYSQSDIGAAIGKRQNTVSALLALNKLPDTIRHEWGQTPSTSRSLLIELAQVDDPAEQIRLWHLIKRGGLTVRDVREERKVAKAAGRPGTPIPSLRLVTSFVASGERALRFLKEEPDQVEPGVLERLRGLHYALGEAIERATLGSVPAVPASRRRKASGRTP